MAKKKTKKKAKKAAGKPAKKWSKKATSKKATKKKTKSKAKRIAGASRPKRATKLPAASLAKLKKLVAAGDFDSQKLRDLDYEILKAVDRAVPDDADRFTEFAEKPAGYWAAWWLEGEVNNGGFHQFFLNKGPAVAARALQFHAERGPEDVADMLRRAIAALPGAELPATYDEMMAVLVPEDPEEDERLMSALNAIDDDFFEREGTLLETRLRYALDHPTEFFA